MMRARTAVLLALGCGIALGAWAGDGIPMGNAVFYPSIEAVYTSTDNLYLQDGTMPNGNENGHFWAIRPTVGFEFPFKESYVRLDIGYQYQDYSSNYNLASHDQYTGNLKGVFKFGNGNSFTIEDGFIHGVQEVTKFDPGYETYYSNTPFNANALRMGLDFALNKLNTLGVYGIYNTVSFTDVNYAFQQPFYDYHQVAGGLLWKYNYRPAANFLLDVRYLENRPDQAWSAQFFNAYNARKYDQWQALTGIEGNLSQVVSGFVKLGWSSMKFTNDYSNFNGFVGDLGLVFKASKFFEVDLKAQRTPFQSAYNVNNFYTATGGELSLHYQASRYFFVTAGYRYQENDYPDATVGYPFGTGGPTIPEWVLSAGETRNDKISRAYAELGYHFNKQFSMKANYQYEDRNSSIHYFFPVGYQRNPYSYTENRVSVSAQFGW
jgi:hypothetical protein